MTNNPEWKNNTEDENIQNRFTAYLVVAIRNTKASYITRQKRDKERLTSLDALLENHQIEPELVSVSDDYALFSDSKTLEDVICNDQLLIAVLKLNERERQIMNLHLLQKMKHYEIADLLGLKPKTVEKCYERAIKKLRTHMGEG